MNRCEGLEKQFKRRFNRDVVVYRIITMEGDTPCRARVKIVYKGRDYLLDEQLQDGLTTNVRTLVDGKENNFKEYDRAEIFIADKMGEADGFAY